MPVYALGDQVPEVDPGAYVHPDAVIIGSVTVAADASIWPTAVLRGDFGRIVVGPRSSVQDGTVVHAGAEYPTLIGTGCVVGHNAYLEGCTLEDRCLVGSMAGVLPQARIGAGAVVAAGAVVTAGVHVPAGAMALGVPARVVPDGAASHDYSAGVQRYVDNARRHARELRRVG
ncbi:MAG: transferase hexapeptide repeat containing protein [Solirubrobacterales bacterium]|nr:transferase hexapeptide repeat containing protein [Solirubrobacterales bacterium]